MASLDLDVFRVPSKTGLESVLSGLPFNRIENHPWARMLKSGADGHRFLRYNIATGDVNSVPALHIHNRQ